MSFTSLFSDQHGWLATDRLVYSEAEIGGVRNALQTAAELSDALRAQNDKVQKAVEAGYSDGYERGLAAGKSEALEAFNAELLKLHKNHNQAVDAQQKACAELAVEIVRKIAGQIAPTDWLVGQACMAASELTEHGALVLRVHGSRLDDVQTRLESKPGVFERVVADDSIHANSCSIETQYGLIAIDLDSQIDQVLHVLTTEEKQHD